MVTMIKSTGPSCNGVIYLEDSHHSLCLELFMLLPGSSVMSSGHLLSHSICRGQGWDTMRVSYLIQWHTRSQQRKETKETVLLIPRLEFCLPVKSEFWISEFTQLKFSYKCESQYFFNLWLLRGAWSGAGA